MDDEGMDSLHKCQMCGSCGRQPWWAPEVLKQLEPRERIRIKRRLEDGRRAFLAAREEAAAKRAAAEAASAALKAFAAVKPIASNSTEPVPLVLGSPMARGTAPGTGMLQSMKTKQNAGFGDSRNTRASLEEIQVGLKQMRESALATYDSDIDSDSGIHHATSPRTPNGGEIQPVSSPSSGDEAFLTPRAEAVGNSEPKTDSISLVDNPPAVQENPGLVAVETPELCAESTITSLSPGMQVGSTESSTVAPCTMGTVSLASSPEVGDLSISAMPEKGTSVFAKEADVRYLDVKAGTKEPDVDDSDSLSRAERRIRELELHVEALQCALKARELVSAGKNSSSRKGGGEVQRLRDEVDSLRLTVDFLFRKLQRYETSEAH